MWFLFGEVSSTLGTWDGLRILLWHSLGLPYNYFIMKTCPCNVDPLTPHFYIVKLGFTGVYIIFLFLLQNIDCKYSLEPPQKSSGI